MNFPGPRKSYQMKTVDLVIILYPVFYAFVAFEMTFCVPNVIYDCTAGFVFNQSATLRFSVGDSRQVGRIFFKESGKTNLFFFPLFFTNYLCLSFYFSVSLLQSCCKFLAIQHPGVTSLMLTLNLVLCPRGAHFHRKYASFLLVPSQLDSTFTVFNYVVVAVTF